MGSKVKDRREAMKTMAAGAAAGAFLSGKGLAKSGRGPNVIFILTDDHRYDAFGFMDKPWLKTPHMDRLAREGVHFTNSFVTTSLCSPARASFLTGQYARRHGVMNNATPWRESSVTFLEIMKRAGYYTGFIGKWHMPGKGLPDLVGQGKADRMISFTFAGGQGVYNDCPMVVDGKKTKTKGYITDVLTDYALDYIDEAKDRPFCLYLSHKAVHAFFEPPERYKGALKDAPLPKVQEKDKELPLGIINGQQLINFDKNAQGYYEALMGVDDGVGRVLERLDRNGLAEDTIVVYAGDNGYFWGEHGLNDKRYAYEESMRIPHLMRWPAVIKEGGVKVDELALNVDLAPTLLSAAGLATPADMQGKSVMPLLTDEDAAWRDSFFYEYFIDPGFPHPGIKAVRTRDWKLINYYGKGKRTPSPEMYDLASDPSEKNNLFEVPAFAKKRTELEKELKRLEEELS